MTGQQGVLIPQSNAKNLMLRPDVIDAVSDGRFAVYTYDNVDEAIELLTGAQAGVRDSRGDYPPESVNFRVEARLREMAELQRAFAKKDGGGDDD